MLFWKKRWKKELDSAVPALSEEVKNYPLKTTGESTVTFSDGSAAKTRKYVTAGVATVIAVLLIALTVVFSVLFAPDGGFKGSVFILEINPSVAFCTDGNGKVTGVTACNSDADVLLSDGNTVADIVGKDAGEAVVSYVDKAARLGYLNPNASSAVRLSACGEEAAAEASALERYFAEKGIFAVVVSETVGAEEFCARSGIEGFNTVEEIAGFVAGDGRLYAERRAESMDRGELRELYEKEMFTDSMAAAVGDKLKENFALIEKNFSDIEKIYSLYSEIFGHKDNPAFIKDYWNVKDRYGTDFDGEFGTLMKDMESALLQYEKDYGVAIVSASQLQDIAKKHMAISLEKLGLLLADFTKDIFIQNLTAIYDIIEFTGLGNDYIESLLTLPEDLQEFINKAKDLFTLEFAYRENKFSEAYDAARESMTAEKYLEYKQSIAEEYGSLSDYWKALKN